MAEEKKVLEENELDEKQLDEVSGGVSGGVLMNADYVPPKMMPN